MQPLENSTPPCRDRGVGYRDGGVGYRDGGGGGYMDGERGVEY